MGLMQVLAAEPEHPLSSCSTLLGVQGHPGQGRVLQGLLTSDPSEIVALLWPKRSPLHGHQAEPGVQRAGARGSELRAQSLSPCPWPVLMDHCWGSCRGPCWSVEGPPSPRGWDKALELGITRGPFSVPAPPAPPVFLLSRNSLKDTCSPLSELVDPENFRVVSAAPALPWAVWESQTSLFLSPGTRSWAGGEASLCSTQEGGVMLCAVTFSLKCPVFSASPAQGRAAMERWLPAGDVAGEQPQGKEGAAWHAGVGAEGSSAGHFRKPKLPQQERQNQGAGSCLAQHGASTLPPSPKLLIQKGSFSSLMSKDKKKKKIVFFRVGLRPNPNAFGKGGNSSRFLLVVFYFICRNEISVFPKPRGVCGNTEDSVVAGSRE
ncbi:uncharacterized protein LOC111942804 [Cyanistes caeruleus]|uniref:uncharacterized protein LOC111942804 n=1 Tax=Cyanistes caeruleus TaxID=156563 RepID=UPI000CDB61EB|nr:uncharacterized protein LOC111942804 [Cyanistes caeruleus]XP_023801662.1 uncharacterized protein LOC111942804 [Cyanistes caeruleus]XP_023801667.1 uncharacterized protein LOC111942804 [Cyanistes caeruleus]XP_023801672.1 uncharacterized protein LOC111942804 [Cyanistes caeruleus]XP_023801676.1 uncharacterized protein LOC111942804 [Cyanistes caeruleus]